MSIDEPSELSKSVADARAVEGPALSVDEPSEQSKSVADAREHWQVGISVDVTDSNRTIALSRRMKVDGTGRERERGRARERRKASKPRIRPGTDTCFVDYFNKLE